MLTQDTSPRHVLQHPPYSSNVVTSPSSNPNARATCQYPDIHAHSGSFRCWLFPLTLDQAMTKTLFFSRDFGLGDCFAYLRSHPH